MKHSKIDYSQLNDRIVRQATEYLNSHVLSAEQREQLILSKFERAKQYSEAFKSVPEIE